MTETKEIKTIDLLDVARSGKIGPIALGSRLSDFANEIGPPARWGDFSDKKRLSCLMVFGEVEVGFIAEAGDLTVTWAKINLARFTRSHMKFGRDLKGEELRISNPFGKRYPMYRLVAKAMQQAGLCYTTDDGNWRIDPPLIMRLGPVTFYFHEEERYLMYVYLESDV